MQAGLVDEPPTLPAISHLAAQHPALQQLVVDVASKKELQQQLPVAMHSAEIVAAQPRNPAPRIQVREGLYFDKHSWLHLYPRSCGSGSFDKPLMDPIWCHELQGREV